MLSFYLRYAVTLIFPQHNMEEKQIILHSPDGVRPFFVPQIAHKFQEKPTGNHSNKSSLVLSQSRSRPAYFIYTSWCIR